MELVLLHADGGVSRKEVRLTKDWIKYQINVLHQFSMKVMTKEGHNRLLLFTVPVHHNHSFFPNSARGSWKVALPRCLLFAGSSEAMQIGRDSIICWFFFHKSLYYNRPSSRGYIFFGFLSNGFKVFKFPHLFLHEQHQVFRYSIIYKKLNTTFHFKSLLKLKIFQSCMIFLNNFNLQKQMRIEQ